MKNNALAIIASTCLILVSCKNLPEGDDIDCVSFQKKADKEADIVVGSYNSVQSVFYHVGGWEWSCCFNTQSGLKEGDSLKVCGYAIKKISSSRYSDYYVNPCVNGDDQWWERSRDLRRRVLYKICDKNQDIAPYIIVGVDTTKVQKEIINKVVGEKDKKLFFKGECYLLYVGDTILLKNRAIAPGYNTALMRFTVPYILVSDSNDIEIRKEE